MSLEQMISLAEQEKRLYENGITGPLKDIILYHGSRGGIEGDIAPISRARCDFGKGFYLGEEKRQAKGLVSEDQDPILYTIKLQLSQIDPSKVLRLSDDEWLYAILAHRKKSPEFSELEAAKQIMRKISHYDVVIGPIADDRMTQAINAFIDRALTTEGLKACLRYIRYGDQYVLKTDAACRLAEILDEKPIRGQELDITRTYVDAERKKSRNIVEEMIDKYQGQGLYLNQLIKAEHDKAIEISL